MTHVDFLLPDFLTGSLSQAETAHVQAHLEHCARCRREREQLEPAMASFNTHDNLAPHPSYFATILPRVRGRIDGDDSRIRWHRPLIERVLLPIAVSALLLFIILSVPTERMNPSSSRGTLKPIVQECTQDELTQLESDTQFNYSGQHSVQETILEDRLSSAQAVPVSILKDAITDGEIDYAVSGMVETLPDEELEVVVQQLTERTVVRL
jgi:hypothetical protein